MFFIPEKTIKSYLNQFYGIPLRDVVRLLKQLQKSLGRVIPNLDPSYITELRFLRSFLKANDQL